MNKTKIDWATMSWNPVTGCRHGCPYCYARRTATRFNAGLEDPAPLAGGLHVLPEKIKATPYPYGFEPTLHRYRLGQPQNTKEPQTVFACSMADLFGRWVPTSWIVEVLDACRGAETGNRPDKVTPARKWVDDIVAFCAENEIPVFFKNNLREHFPDLPASAFPWEV